MDDAPITTEVADAQPPTTDAEMTSEMGDIYDAHHSEESEPSGYVEHEPDNTESFADTEQQVETPKSPAALPMPRSWSKEQAAVWNTLSPEAQAYVAQRDAQQHKAITELGQRAAQGGGDVGAVYEHYRNQGLVPIGEDGVTELSAPQVVEHALEFDQALRRNPHEVIQALAQAHGVELGSVQGHQHADLEQWQQAYGEVAQQLERIKADHAGWQQQIERQQQQQYAARYQQLESELDKYASERKHWGEIENEVIAQVHALRASGMAHADPMTLLREAEKRALKVTGIDPDAGEKQAAKAAEQKRKADEAKRLASLNVGRRGLGKAPTSNLSWEETMRDTYDRVTGFRG